MATQTLRLLLALHNLMQVINPQQLISHLEAHQATPNPQSSLDDSKSTMAKVNTPQVELAQLISSIIQKYPPV